MATVTLTPLHYYQVDENHAVTEIDPTTKKIQYNTKFIVVEFAYDNSFRHKHISNMAVSFSGRSGDDNFSIYKTRSDVAPAVGEKIHPEYRSSPCFERISGTDDFNFLDNFTAGYSTFLIWIDSVYTNTNFSFRSISVTLTYDTENRLKISMSPISGYLKHSVANEFTVTASNTGTILQKFKLVSGTIKYKLASASSYTSIAGAFSSVPYTITIPANTLAAESTYNIYVTGAADDGTSSNYSETGTFNTNDGEAIGTPVAPKNTLERGDILFTWSYYNEKGTPQHAAEIRYKVGSSGSYVYSGKTVTSDTSKRISIQTAGTIYWSVRCWNSNDVGGSWSSEVSFENAIPPAAPTITSITQNGRPTLNWISSNQIAFQVQALRDSEVFYDSGVIYSGAQNYRTKTFIPDGSYIFRVRVYNSYGYSSEWSSINYEQDYSGLPTVPFSAETIPDGVILRITPNSAYANYYIMRNGTLIALMSGSSYTDRFPSAENVYTLIAATNSGRTKFEEIEVTYVPKSTSIKTADGTKLEASRRWTQRIKPSKSVTPEFELYSFIGAERPEIVVSKMRNIRYSFGFYDELRIAETLIGRDLFYSDIFGNAEWCQITSITRSDEWFGNETVLELTAVMHDEEIEIV